MRKRTRSTLTLCFCILSSLSAQDVSSQRKTINWEHDTDQKVWGLMTVWAETKFAFPHRDRLDAINWDSTAQSFIPRVIAANSEESYYNTLMEMTALLRDSHTEIIPPWGRLRSGYDIPPVEIAILDDRFYIIRMGAAEELTRQNVHPGMELLEVGDGIPVSRYFQENVLKYHTRGTKHGSEAILIMYLLYGPSGSVVEVKVRDTNGKVRDLTLTRNAMAGTGKPFMYGFLGDIFARSIRVQLLEDEILYVLIPNFEGKNKEIREGFLRLIDTTDLAGIKGMIIDLRHNTGGSHTVMHPMVQCLIDTSVNIPTHHFVQYCPAPSRWSTVPAFTMRSRDWEIEPREGKRYHGPIALLIGPITHSSGEDMVIELSQRAGCITVGEPTSGGAGGRYPFPLPGGGEFSVSTFKAMFPDGREYMENGIQPDYLVRPSLDDLVEARDVVLGRAAQLLQDGTSSRTE